MKDMTVYLIRDLFKIELVIENGLSPITNYQSFI
jgi:hypothetical protein